MHLGSSTAEMPVTFQNDTITLTPNLPASRLHESGKTHYSLVNRGQDGTRSTDEFNIKASAVVVKYGSHVTDLSSCLWQSANVGYSSLPIQTGHSDEKCSSVCGIIEKQTKWEISSVVACSN